MFMIRNVTMDDMPDLLRMAKTVHSNNLPSNEHVLRKIIDRSENSFGGTSALEDRFFTFVLQDMEANRVAGTSAIIARRGVPGFPRLYLKIRRHQHYSSELQSGQVQMTMQLCQDVEGVTEVGGLVLSPAYRSNPERLGSFLSKVRFSFIGMHPDWFMEDIVAEVMGVLTPDGRTKLWDHLGRRFINLAYQEADVFSRISKEFITSLFPKGEIHASLLPAEARKLIGTASDDAMSALRMLERLGFEQVDEVDPFDGGPYLRAQRDEIPLVRESRHVVLAGAAGIEEGPEAFVSLRRGDQFRCVRCPWSLDGESLSIPADVIECLQARTGDTLGFTPEVVRTRTAQEHPDTDSVRT